jgi:hypothetical protein
MSVSKTDMGRRTAREKMQRQARQRQACIERSRMYGGIGHVAMIRAVRGSFAVQDSNSASPVRHDTDSPWQYARKHLLTHRLSRRVETCFRAVLSPRGLAILY